jgi:hypothetical protein
MELLVIGQNVEQQQEAPVGPDDLMFYVTLVDGTVLDVWPATGFVLTPTELVAVLGEIPVARFKRDHVCYAARPNLAVPAFF